MQDPQSTQHRLSARGHPGAHRLISSPPVKSAAGPVITYYTFTGAVGRQTPLLLKSVGPVWHLRWLRPAAPLPRRLWQLWRTRRPGGWAKRLFSLWSQKITCMDRNPRHLTLDIGVVRLRDIVSVGLPLRQSIYIYMHNVVISAPRCGVAPPTTCILALSLFSLWRCDAHRKALREVARGICAMWVQTAAACLRSGRRCSVPTSVMTVTLSEIPSRPAASCAHSVGSLFRRRGWVRDLGAHRGNSHRYRLCRTDNSGWLQSLARQRHSALNRIAQPRHMNPDLTICDRSVSVAA